MTGYRSNDELLVLTRQFIKHYTISAIHSITVLAKDGLSVINIGISPVCFYMFAM
jgi:hypothetical protein